MNKLFFLIFPVLLFSCGDNTNEEVEEVVKLETQKDRLSYVLGAMNAKTIVGTQDPRVPPNVDDKETSERQIIQKSE